MSSTLPDKSTVIEALRAKLSREVEAVERVAAAARDEATSGETKAEGKYDTRATEASYLARGQARRITELRRLQSWFDTFDFNDTTSRDGAQLGSLAAIEGDVTEWVFLAPAGGARVEIVGRTVKVVSPRSPLGSEMVGLEVGDAFEVDTPRGIKTFEITALA